MAETMIITIARRPPRSYMHRQIQAILWYCYVQNGWMIDGWDLWDQPLWEEKELIE